MKKKYHVFLPQRPFLHDAYIEGSPSPKLFYFLLFRTVALPGPPNRRLTKPDCPAQDYRDSTLRPFVLVYC